MTYKIIFFSSSEFGIPILQTLGQDEDNFKILAVVTQPDKKAGRGQKPAPTPIKTFAQKHSYSVLSPETLKSNKEFEKLLRGFASDYFVVAAYGQIIPSSMLQIPKIAPINVHGSLLPKYRGASPIQTAILNGDKETGITIMEMNEKMDEGDIYMLKRMQINELDDYETLLKRMAEIAAFILPYALIDIAERNLKKIKQDGRKATYSEKIKKESGYVRFKKMTAEKIMRILKAFKTWPGCYTKWNGKLLKIHSAEIYNGGIQAKAGKIIFIDKNTIGFGTQTKIIIPKILQLEGKSNTTAKEFINGYKKALEKHNVAD